MAPPHRPLAASTRFAAQGRHPLPEDHPERADDKDRRVRARDDADQKREREVLNRAPAKEVQRHDGKQGGQAGVDLPGQGLVNARVDQFDQILRGLSRRFSRMRSKTTMVLLME